jgi:hypothetical protein
MGGSQSPRGVRRGSAAVRLLGSWVRIPPDTWLSVSCECCVLSGRGLCDLPITRPGESECGVSPSVNAKPWPAIGCRATGGGGESKCLNNLFER